MTRPSLQIPRPLKKLEHDDTDQFSKEQASVHNASYAPRNSIKESHQRSIFNRNSINRRDTIRPSPLTIVSGKNHSRTLSRVPEKKDFKIS
jgi:hypothetical protein